MCYLGGACCLGAKVLWCYLIGNHSDELPGKTDANATQNLRFLKLGDTPVSSGSTSLPWESLLQQAIRSAVHRVRCKANLREVENAQLVVM